MPWHRTSSLSQIPANALPERPEAADADRTLPACLAFPLDEIGPAFPAGAPHAYNRTRTIGMREYTPGAAMTAQPTSDRERLVKLALVVKERGPIGFAGIRRLLPGEYGPADDGDADAQRRHEDAVRRKFERDKKTLQDYGFYFTTDAENRYSLDEDATFSAPVDLDDTEASLLRLLCSALLDDASYPFKSELRMILTKLGDELDLPDLLSPAASTPKDGRPAAGLKKIRKALRTRKRLSFDYTDARGAISKREVEPTGCFLFDRHLYLVAYDPAAKAERSFRLDRIGHVSINAKRPSQPDFEPRAFDAADYFGLPFQFGDGDFTARVRFDAAHSWQTKRLCMGRGTLEEHEDGTVWTIAACNAEALARWCVENGPGIVPLAPEEAVRAYRDGVRAFLQRLDAPSHRPTRSGEGE